ncbi:G-type lectin S-receptor-like serine/threonine-protein kinase, partial [Ananas comosus]
SNGSIVVKRLLSSSGQGLEVLENEITLIAKLQHRNLVKLLGYCIQKEEKILICEYMPNKSLNFYIFNCISSPLSHPLKSSNNLLDREMNSKILDFGLARIK